MYSWLRTVTSGEKLFLSCETPQGLLSGDSIVYHQSTGRMDRPRSHVDLIIEKCCPRTTHQNFRILLFSTRPAHCLPKTLKMWNFSYLRVYRTTLQFVKDKVVLLFCMWAGSDVCTLASNPKPFKWFTSAGLTSMRGHIDPGCIRGRHEEVGYFLVQSLVRGLLTTAEIYSLAITTRLNKQLKF